MIHRFSSSINNLGETLFKNAWTIVTNHQKYATGNNIPLARIKVFIPAYLPLAMLVTFRRSDPTTREKRIKILPDLHDLLSFGAYRKVDSISVQALKPLRGLRISRAGNCRFSCSRPL